MPSLFIFLLKVNIALVIFYLAYHFVLRKLTFYTLNRFFLVFAILFSSVYPLCDFSHFFESQQQLQQPIRVIAPVWHAAANASNNYWPLITTFFWIGVIFMAVRLVIQFISLYKICKKSEKVQMGQHTFRQVDTNIDPFSFWRTIYINAKEYPEHELKTILAHEQVHVDQWHTLDVLTAELSIVFYWFNPGIWLIKRAVQENLEFITDQKILQAGANKKQYQYGLLKIGIKAHPAPLVNHFNMSTIKRRIIMMNANRSSALNISRYVLALPIVIIATCIFTLSKAGLGPKASVIDNLIKPALVVKNEQASAHKQNISISPANIPTHKTTSSANQQTAVSTFKLAAPSTAKRADSIQSDSVQHLLATHIPKQEPMHPESQTSQPRIDMATTATNKVITVIGRKGSFATNSSNKPFNLTLTKDVLLIVDGIETPSSDMALMKPDDIYRIDVVKDEATKKKYGKKANNGILFIQTKKGQISQ